jgi:magnesium-transporting ATPase (P-type)
MGLRRGLFANKFLNISMGLSMAILFAVMYVPFLGGLFSTVPLSLSQFAVGSAFVLVPVLGSEFAKRVFNSNQAAR